MRVSIPPPPPPPSGRSLTQNRATIQKRKIKQLLLSCLPTISIMISTITSRKQSLGRLSLFAGPLWTTIYIFPESSSDFAYETTPLPLPAPGTWSRCEYEVQHEKNQYRGIRKERKNGKGKEKTRKKDTKHCIFVCNFVGVFFLVFFLSSSSFYKIFSLKKT